MKKFYTPILAGIFALGLGAASITPAEAGRSHHGHHGGGIAAGIAFGLFAGALLYEAERQSYRSNRRHRVRCKRPTRRWHGHREWGGEGHRHRHCGRHYHD